MEMISNSILLKELLDKQLKDVPLKYKLQYGDLKRISKYINTSIFNEQTCCIWTGYVTNENKKNKGTYINFYFKQKKMALHRLLYMNFIGDLTNDDYLKFNCDYKGKCCNVHHMKIFSYKRSDEDEAVECVKKKQSSNTYSTEPSLWLDFDI